LESESEGLGRKNSEKPEIGSTKLQNQMDQTFVVLVLALLLEDLLRVPLALF